MKWKTWKLLSSIIFNKPKYLNQMLTFLSSISRISNVQKMPFIFLIWKKISKHKVKEYNKHIFHLIYELLVFYKARFNKILVLEIVSGFQKYNQITDFLTKPWYDLFYNLLVIFLRQVCCKKFGKTFKLYWLLLT